MTASGADVAVVPLGNGRCIASQLRLVDNLGKDPKDIFGRTARDLLEPEAAAMASIEKLRINGVPAVGMGVVKQSKANALDVAEAVRDLIARSIAWRDIARRGGARRRDRLLRRIDGVVVRAAGHVGDLFHQLLVGLVGPGHVGLAAVVQGTARGIDQPVKPQLGSARRRLRIRRLERLVGLGLRVARLAQRDQGRVVVAPPGFEAAFEPHGHFVKQQLQDAESNQTNVKTLDGGSQCF